MGELEKKELGDELYVWGKRGIKGDSVCQVSSVVAFQPYAHLTIVCSFFFVLICSIFFIYCGYYFFFCYMFKIFSCGLFLVF